MPVLVGLGRRANELSWTPVVLFVVMFLWTPPHFWALAIRYADDYRAANVPMLPAVVPLELAARKMIGIHGGDGGVQPVADPGCRPRPDLRRRRRRARRDVPRSPPSGSSRNPTPANSMRVFGYSITYVTLLFGAMMLDVLI